MAVERMDAEIDQSRVFSWSVIGVSIAATVLVNASFALVPMIGRGTGLISGKTPLWLTLGVVAAIVAMGVACLLWAWRRGVARIIRRHLVAAGVPVCLQCGYPLRGLDVKRCPECGADVDSRAQSARVAGGQEPRR